jgi:hypothetical protein
MINYICSLSEKVVRSAAWRGDLPVSIRGLWVFGHLVKAATDLKIEVEC